MRWNLVGPFVRNHPFGTEIAYKKGLQRIGETVVSVDPSVPGQELDPEADVTVVFKWLDDGPVKEQLKNWTGIKVVYQPDDLRFAHIKQMMVDMKELCSYAWTFDDDGVRLAKEFGYLEAERLLLTADDELYRPLNLQKDIDVCFVGSLTAGENHASRRRMVQIVSKIPGINFFAGEIWGAEKICEVYNRSKVVLNHATDVGQPFGQGFGYQCRHFEAGLTKACVLSNYVTNATDLRWFFTYKNENELVENVKGLLASSGFREASAEKFYSELKSGHMPEHRAQEMVRCVRRWMFELTGSA